MKKIIFIFVILLTVVGCKKNERMIYEEQGKVYMNNIMGYDWSGSKYIPVVVDSVIISIANNTEAKVEYSVPVQLLGQTEDRDRTFKVEIVQEGTTAIEGTHYEGVKDFYTIAAGETEGLITFTLIKGDEELAQGEKRFELKIVEGGDLSPAYSDHLNMDVIFSAVFRRPVDSGTYQDMTAFINFFGEYSETKHIKIMELAGHDFWDDSFEWGYYSGTRGIAYEGNYWKPWALVLLDYYTNNVVNDENGNQIMPWVIK